MSSPFTLTIDWLSFTLPTGTGKETMDILEGEWIKSQAGFRGYPLSWTTVASDRGVGKLGTGAPRTPLEVHVDLSAGIVSAWSTAKVRSVFQWVRKQEGHLTRLDCALDDRTMTVPLKIIKEAIQSGQCVTRADRMQTIASSSIHKGTPSGETLYLGSPHSQTLLRIYDKRAELQAKGRQDWECVRHSLGTAIEARPCPGLRSGALAHRRSGLARIRDRGPSLVCGLPRDQPGGTR